jgi:ATP-dependent RNA helicase DDX10/DBP4
MKNVSRDAMSSDSETEDMKKKKDEVKTKYDRLTQRTNQDVFSSHYRELLGDEASDDDSDEDFLSVKRVINGDGMEQSGQKEKGPKVVDLGGTQLVIDSHRREKLLKSKKKLANLRGKGTKLVFDDEGNSHAIYELQGEDEFHKQGPEDLRQQFMETEGARIREADVEDKQLVKEKKKEKRLKRKARERGEDLDQAGAVVELDGAPDELNGEDPLDLLRSLPMPGEPGSEGEAEEEERPKKKAKKWFQDDSDDDAPKHGGKKIINVSHEPETLEDFENLARGLLE